MLCQKWLLERFEMASVPNSHKNPLHELLIWLVAIWSSVLFIYLTNHSEPPKQSRSAAVVLPPTNNSGSPVKHTEQTVNADRGRQKKTVTTSSSPAAKPAKRDTQGASSIQPVEEPKQTHSPSSDQPTDTSAYLAMVQRRIINEWHPPAINQRMDVVVGFKLSRSGQIVDIFIEQSSGNGAFDMAAKEAVLSASPLPVLPADFQQDEMTTRLRFSNES